MNTIRLLAVLLDRDAIIVGPLGLGRVGLRLEQRRTSCGLSMLLKAKEDAESDGDGEGQEAKVDEEANRHG
jgi:hypothetical protein